MERAFIAACAAILFVALSARAEALVLAENGHTAYDIVISADQASPSEKFAAEELSMFLNQITGASFPVTTDDRVLRQRHIFVGDSRALRQVAPDLDLSGLGFEGYVIKTVGPHLILAGARQRGSMYAVYGLLEDHIGCRWFTPTVSRIPRIPRLVLPPLDERVIPKLEYREPFFYVAFDAHWNVRNRMNGNSSRIPPEMGDRIRYLGFVHTFYSLLPPDKYFDEHPEYYALVNGKRRRSRAQLCLTNPDVLRLVTEEVRRRLRWAREHGWPEDIIISVSQNDCWGYCECPKCRALAEYEGSQAGPIIHFVNKIAEAIEDEFPHAAIDTLAYTYSRKPPKHVRPRHNVIVRLCSIECCFSHPLETCPQNRSFMEDLRGWAKICKRLYVWDYVTNFRHYLQPFPNLRVLGPNIRTFVNHNVRGIFEEGNYHSPGEFSYLRSYVLAKCLWNPDYDWRKAMDEFLEAYYGPAAPYIRQYIDLIHDTVEREQIHVHIFSPPTQPFLRDEILDRADELFDRAEAAVRGNEELLWRVRGARLPILYVRIARFSPQYRILGGELVPRNVDRYTRWLEEFGQIAKRLNITFYREGRKFWPWYEQLPRTFPTMKLVRIKTPDLRAELVPQAGGCLLRLFDRCLYRNVMYTDTADPRFPVGSGYSDFEGVTWPEKAVVQPWRVEKSDEYSVVLTWQGDGVRLRRTMILDPAQPVVRIRLEATNIKGKPRETILRMHPCFRLGDVDQVQVIYTDRAGQQRSIDLSQIEGRERDIFLQGDDMPAGRWIAYNRAFNYGILAEFRPEQVGKCLLNFGRGQDRVNLELYSPVRVLKPGESMAVEYTWRILREVEGFLSGGPWHTGFGRWSPK